MLTSFFLPDSVGGGETHTLQLSKALRRRGHDVRIWRPRSAAPMHDDYEYEGIPVELVPSAGSPNDGGDVASASWLRTRLRQRPVDVVHVMIGGRCKALMAAVARAGLPMVVTFLDFHYWCSRALRRADNSLCDGPESVEQCHQCLLESAGRLHLAGPLWRKLPPRIRQASKHLPRIDIFELSSRRLAAEAAEFQQLVSARSVFVAPSPIMRRLAENAAVPPGRIIDLPYGVPSDFVGAARQKTSSCSLRLAYFGRLVPEKGVDILLQAVSRLPRDVELEVQLYGSAPQEAREYRERLEILASADLRIRFCGTVNQSQLPDIHKNLDLVVIPSLWHENATIVLLESLALGTPVIASDVQGMAPFIASGRNGFVFPVGDIEGLATRLRWCAANRPEVLAMSENCAALVTADEHAIELEKVYGQFAAHGG